MSRTLTAGVTAEVQKAEVRAEAIAHFAFDSGSLRFWTGVGDLEWNGDTYIGTGNLGGISPVEESGAVKTSDLSFTLSGLPASLISVALGEHYQGRLCELWVGFFDTSGVLIDDPVPTFAGRMDTMTVVDNGDTASITVVATNRLKDLDRPNHARFYTDQDQQEEFPGDLGFQFVPEMQDAVIIWGKGIMEPAVGGAVATQGGGPPGPGPVVTPPPGSPKIDDPDLGGDPLNPKTDGPHDDGGLR